MVLALEDFYELPQGKHGAMERRDDLRVGHYDEAFFTPKLKGIIGVELTITRLEGKFKLSQNIPAESREIGRASCRERV